MLQLNPAENFPIVRVLKDHTDSSTNYVRAVIRDATTDALIATLDLDDLGSRRFRKVWKVAYDNAYMRGRYIVITTTVYTDAGYTTKNDNYFEEADTYLVQERFNNHAQFGGGGTDFKEFLPLFRKLLADELADIKGRPDPEFPDMPDLSASETRILEGVKAYIASLPPTPAPVVNIPPVDIPKPADLAPLLREIQKIGDAIAARPQFERTDFGPLLDQLRTFVSDLEAMHREYKADADKLLDLVMNDEIKKHEAKRTVDRKDIISQLTKRYAISG